MRPTPDQIERARLVSLWRKRCVPLPSLTWCDYEPVGTMELLGLEWPLDDFNAAAPLRPDQQPPNHPNAPERIISNRPSRPETTTPKLELPDDFPY